MSKKHRVIIILICLAVAALGLFVLLPLYDTYRNRPLADGLQYVGRDYNTACLPVLGCFGTTTENLYYATNTPPDKVINQLDGWKVTDTHHAVDELWGSQETSNATGYQIKNTASDETSYYGYIEDKAAVTKASRLLPNDKRYIIVIRGQDYEMLRQR